MTIEMTPECKAIHDQATIVDLHAHPSLAVSLFNKPLTRSFRASRYFNPFSVRTDFIKLREGGLDVLLSVVYAPEPQLLEECRPLRLLRYLMPRAFKRAFGHTRFQTTVDMLDTMERTVGNARDGETGRMLARVCHSVRELNECLAEPGARPIAVVHCIEGAHSLDGQLENLDQFFDRGVAYLTLAHFYRNKAVNPIFPFPESVQKFGCFQGDRDVTLGLERFGEQVVERMLELGIILDIAHCTPPARRRIYDIVGTRRPMIASHVGAFEVNPSPYNLTDWEIKKIADTGGVVGVIFMNYWLMPHETHRGLNYITFTLRHLINVAGIDHVAIGTDFDGFTDPPDDLADASELPRLTQRLLAEGYSAAEIHKIIGGNALRVLRQGWGRRQ